MMPQNATIPTLSPAPLRAPAGDAPVGAPPAAQTGELAPGSSQGPHERLEIFHGYMGIFVVSFLVTLVLTPVMRRLAIANGIVDRPSSPRKHHRRPVAYLGGVAVFLGLVAGIFFSYVAPHLGAFGEELVRFHRTRFQHVDLGVPHPVPLSILLGMTIIMLLGLIDDVVGTLPRLKLAGMCVAAAALAMDNVGVDVARGVLSPTLGAWLNNTDLRWIIELPFSVPLLGTKLPLDLIYWSGTAIIAIAVLGACNASNLIDGLDGLLSGVTAIAAIGLLIVALTLASHDDGPRDSQRLVLCMALAGACLGFLPHNFNPATIFLGDAGSLLLGFTTIVIVLSLGDQGKTNLVLAGLVMYSIPIIDTVLAIIRRKLAGKSISEADDQHLHHMLKRSLGVKGAVFALYGIGLGFALLGIAMSLWQARITYVLTLLFASYIGVIAIKSARRRQLELAEQAALAPAPVPAAEAARPVPAKPERAEPAAAASYP